MTDHADGTVRLKDMAGLQGVAVPLTAAALGGLVGAALWFGRRSLVVPSVLGTLAVYGVLGLMEVAPVLQGLHFGAHLMIAVFALLALRIGLQTVLLHEEHDPVPLEPGVYEVRRQREYAPQAPRLVRD